MAEDHLMRLPAVYAKAYYQVGTDHRYEIVRTRHPGDWGNRTETTGSGYLWKYPDQTHMNAAWAMLINQATNEGRTIAMAFDNGTSALCWIGGA
jgi:hypothetical protein